MAIVCLILAGLVAMAVEITFPIAVRADFLVAIALAWSLRRDPTSSCIGAACLGLIGDMACDDRLGFETALFGATAFAISTIRDRSQPSSLSQPVVVVLAAMLMLALFAIARGVAVPTLVQACTVSGLTTGVLAVVIATAARCLVSARLRYAH